MGDPVAQQRVGQQPDAVEVDEDGRVPDVLDPRHGRTLVAFEPLTQGL